MLSYILPGKTILKRGICAAMFLFLCGASLVHAQVVAPSSALPTDTGSVEKARVLSIEQTEIQDIPGTTTSETIQTLSALVLSGTDAGKTVTVENDYLPMQIGDVFFLTHTDTPDAYTVLEPDRLPALAVLLGIFIIAIILVGGWTGMRALLALALSIIVVFYVLVPGILAGYNPVLVASVVGGVIVIFGSYLTHGINRTTSAAVVGLLLTVAITACIAHYAILFTHLSGFSEESVADLDFASNGSINLVGLLLAAMLIGALGILYDAAISQAVAVEELLRVAPDIGLRRLFARAMRIGREHIGALVNTLAIAYVGVSLPLILLYTTYTNEPFLQIINHEMFATEIVRTIVGSIGILLAVPLSTVVAVFLLTQWRNRVVSF